jgi:hypothetical protein
MASLSSLRIITAIGQLIGTSTSDTASAGNVGEEKVSRITTSTNTGASAAYFDATSLAMSAGTWDVKAAVEFSANTGVFTSVVSDLGISLTTGNSSTGLVTGDTRFMQNSSVPIAFTAFTMWLPTIRVYSDGTNMTVGGQSSAAGTTLYLKARISVFTSGQPQYRAYIQAVRVR